MYVCAVVVSVLSQLCSLGVVSTSEITMADSLQTEEAYLNSAKWGAAATAVPPEPEMASGDSVGVIIIVVFGVLVVMSLLFFFAIFIDCRNQEEERARRKACGLKAARHRQKSFRLSTFFHGRGANGDSLAFASQMCEENQNTSPIILHNGVTKINITETTPTSSSVQH